MSTQIQISPKSELTIGTSAIASGTVGRILFHGTGSVVQEDSNLFWDNTNKRLGIGATPSTSVRLDVRAQGALSTDIAFNVRNSADTVNLFQVLGDGQILVSVLKWTIDLTGVLTGDIYPNFAGTIDSVTDLVGTPVTTILLNGAAYTLTNPIASGDKITITVDVVSVIDLNFTVT